MAREPKTLEDWHLAIASDPGNSANYRGRGTAYARMGQPHHALADFSTAIQLDPSDAANYRERGTAYGQLGQIDSAIADLDVAILWDKNDADAYYRRAMLHVLMGDRQRASNDLLDVIRIDPEHAEARYQFGLIRGEPGPPAQEEKEGVVKFVWGRLPRGVWGFVVYSFLAAVIVSYLVSFCSAPSDEGANPREKTSPDQRYMEEKLYMLELVNNERSLRRLTPLVLGDNVAAQLHAEALTDECFLSHWGLDGLKPYMRYSLAGGYQGNAENVAGGNYCPSRSIRYAPVSDIQKEIEEAVEGWMDSPGHREAMLDPWARKINIGLEWRLYNFTAVQQFEGDYVEYAQLPALEGTTLTVAGRLKNGMSFDGSDGGLSVVIFYDPPPVDLTRGQVARTYCYDVGVPVATIRKPPPQGSYYGFDESDETAEFCPSPLGVPSDAPAPASEDEARELWSTARDASRRGIEREVPVFHITASRWVAKGAVFSVRANIVAVTNRHGPGIYTVAIVTESRGDDVLLSQYSIFHETVPPS